MAGRRAKETEAGEAAGVATMNGPSPRVAAGSTEEPAAAPTEAPAAGDAADPRGGATTATGPRGGMATGSPLLTADQREVLVHVDVIVGGFTNVAVQVGVCPRYQGMALAGPARAFDRQIDSWISRAVDLGMIGSGLGQIFPLNLRRSHDAGRVKVDSLLMAGMGEPGRFAADDLRYLMSNVTVAVKSMRFDHLSTMLIGTRRNELSIGQAARGFLEGILDGYARYRAIADAVKFEREEFLKGVEKPLFISLVNGDAERARLILEAFRAIAEGRSIPGLQLEVDSGGQVDPDPEPDPNTDVEPYIHLTLLRITKRGSSPMVTSPANPAPAGMASTEFFEFSGISDTAAVTVRDREANPYFIRELPDRVSNASTPEEQESFGTFFANYLIPDDFRVLAEGSSSMTLELDDTTAGFPWEMAAHKKYSRTSFLGTSVGISRQFRTLLAPPPCSLPPLNRLPKILIIADPAPGDLALPHARDEGLVVLDVLERAQKAWKGEFEFQVTVRIGPIRDPGEEDPLSNALASRGDWIVSAKPCDPFELTTLIVDEHFDIIHYAGHGSYDRKSGRAGWVFNQDCFLSAQEIFSVRQVPRLVFANACFSAVTTRGEERGSLVGLAQAFFARGIPNFIGTGWKVQDACALECARWFYTRVLGLRSPQAGGAVIGTAPPATIGESLLTARRKSTSSARSPPAGVRTSITGGSPTRSCRCPTQGGDRPPMPGRPHGVPIHTRRDCPGEESTAPRCRNSHS